MEGKGIPWGTKGFSWTHLETSHWSCPASLNVLSSLPTEAVWPHLMFYRLSLPTLLQTFKLHFLLELSSAHIHTNLQTGWFQFFATVTTAANTEVQISQWQDMESSGYKSRREIAGLYCGSVLKFWGPYKLMFTMTTLICTPNSA